jgi:hypothetical protein
VAQRALTLAKSASPRPALVGLALKWRPELQAPPAWLSPKRLQALQSLMLPPPQLPVSPGLAPPSPPQLEPSSFNAATPVARDDFAAWAAEFGDQAALERLKTDPTYRPWQVPDGNK